jgi:hypothetical protein
MQNGTNRYNPTAGELAAAKKCEAGTAPDVKRGELSVVTKSLLWLGYKTEEIKPILKELTGTTLAEEKAKKKGKKAAPLTSPAAHTPAAAESQDMSAENKQGDATADKHDTARPAASASQANESPADVEVAPISVGNADCDTVAALTAVRHRDASKGHGSKRAAPSVEGAPSKGDAPSSAADEGVLPWLRPKLTRRCACHRQEHLFRGSHRSVGV